MQTDGERLKQLCSEKDMLEKEIASRQLEEQKCKEEHERQKKELQEKLGQMEQEHIKAQEKHTELERQVAELQLFKDKAQVRSDLNSSAEQKHLSFWPQMTFVAFIALGIVSHISPGTFKRN